VLTFRWGGPEDAALGAEIWDESNTARRGGVKGPDAHRDRVLLSFADPLNRVGFAELEGTTVGVVRWSEPWVSDEDHSRVPGVCHIGLVFVRPEAWRRGVGRLLLREAMADGIAHGCTRAQLWTHADNARSRALYLRAGFRDTGETKLNDIGEPIVRFERSLAPTIFRVGEPVGDADLVLRIWREANLAHGLPATSAAEESSIRAEFFEPSSNLVIAEIDDEVVGVGRFADAETSPEDHRPIPGLAHMGLVAVRPERWGMGIGRAMTKQLVLRAAGSGYRRVRLRTSADNVRARALYESEGFTLISETNGVTLYERPLP
jgi:ribosomal protein S18 acetylase RimI-like enzyme